MALNIKGVDYIKLPYYVTSLKTKGEKTDTVSLCRRNSDKGLHGIWGFDYDYKDKFDGFIDFEISEKQKLSLKTLNNYKLTENNTGSVFVKIYNSVEA